MRNRKFSQVGTEFSLLILLLFRACLEKNESFFSSYAYATLARVKTQLSTIRTFVQQLLNYLSDKIRVVIIKL